MLLLISQSITNNQKTNFTTGSLSGDYESNACHLLFFETQILVKTWVSNKYQILVCIMLYKLMFSFCIFQLTRKKKQSFNLSGSDTHFWFRWMFIFFCPLVKLKMTLLDSGAILHPQHLCVCLYFSVSPFLSFSSFSFLFLSSLFKYIHVFKWIKLVRSDTTYQTWWMSTSFCY